MFASLHKVKPVWAVTFLFLCASTVHAQSSEPVDPLQAAIQAGIAAFEKGDYDQAIAKLQKPAATFNGDALYYLGEAVTFHAGRAGYLKQAFNVHKLGVEAGDKRAQFRMAEMLATGVPERQDIDDALTLLRQSAEAGYVPAREALPHILQARAQAREWSDKIKPADLMVTPAPEAVGMPGHLFGGDAQATCADVREAALLSATGRDLYDRYSGDLLQYHYNTVDASIVSRPSLVAFYAHVMAADRAQFKTCAITQGVPAGAETTIKRVNTFGLVQFGGTKDHKMAPFWLVPNKLDTNGNRLGSATGAGYFLPTDTKLVGCSKEASTKIVLNGATPDVVKSCVSFQLGMVAATGRSLKVSQTDEKGYVYIQLLPEVVVIGQFGKLFYLNRVEVMGNSSL